MTGSLAAGLSSGSVLILVALGLVIVHRFAVRPGYSWPRLATAAGTLLVAGSAGLLLSPGHLGLHPVAVAGDEVQLRQLVIPAVAFAAVVALFLVFRHTRFGLAMRAAASDREGLEADDPQALVGFDH
ncbi:MAG: hypothetical protein ABIS86_15235 [Streptosporangiaceae bacterium]